MCRSIGLYGAKLSILALYLRIFSVQRGTRIFTWVAIVLTIGVWLFKLITDSMNRAPPPGKPWTKEYLIRDTTVQPTINLIAGYLNLALDVMIFIIPIRASWNLQMGLKWKAKMMAVFATGLLWVHQH